MQPRWLLSCDPCPTVRALLILLLAGNQIGWGQTPASWNGYDISALQSSGTISLVTPLAAPAGTDVAWLQVVADEAGGPTAPVPPGGGTQQGVAVFSGTQGSTWLRVGLQAPPAGGVGDAVQNSPFIALSPEFPPDEVALLGSQFTEEITAQASAWPIPALTRVSANLGDRPDPTEPFDLGIVLTAAGGHTPTNPLALARLLGVGGWQQSEPFPEALFDFAVPSLLGGFALPTASPGERTFLFQSLFLPDGFDGGAFYQMTDEVVSTEIELGSAVGEEGDPWVLLQGHTVITADGALVMAGATGDGLGYAGMYDLTGDLTVEEGGSITTYDALQKAYNSTTVAGVSNLIEGPGTIELGQLTVASRQLVVQNGVVTAHQGGPSAQGDHPWPAILLLPQSHTTLMGGATFSSPDNMEIWEGAFLRGIGQIHAEGGILSAGEIIPGVGGATSGTLTLSSDTSLILDPRSVIRTTVTPAGQTRLTLGATPTLGGGLVIRTQRDVGEYREGQRFVVLSAPSWSGAFEEVLTPGAGPLSAFLSIELQRTSTQYAMVVRRLRDYADLTCSENGCPIAGCLDEARAMRGLSSEWEEVLAAVDQLPWEAFSCACCFWDRIGGVEVPGALATATMNTELFSRALQDALWSTLTPTTSAEGCGPFQVWLEGAYANTRWNGGDPALAVRDREGYGLLGLRIEGSRGWHGGVAGLLARGHQDWRQLESHARSQQYGLALYGGWHRELDRVEHQRRGYATLSAQLTRPQVRLFRAGWDGTAAGALCTTCPSAGCTQPIDLRGWSGGGRGEVGLCLQREHFFWQPYLGLEGAWSRLEAFCSEGLLPVNRLRGESSSYSVGWLTPGVRVAGTFTGRTGVEITPEVAVQVQQLLGALRPQATLAWQGIPCCYDVQGAPFARTAWQGIAGLSGRYGSFSCQLRGSWLASSDWRSGALDLRLSWCF